MVIERENCAVCDWLEDREGPRPHDPAGSARAGGPGDRVVNRRTWLVGSFSLLAAPFTAEAQPTGRIHRIGVLGTSDGPGWQAFRDGLQSLGYHEGRTIAVDWRWAGSDARRMADLAADLVRLQVELIVTGSDPAPTAARDATRIIPIVMSGAGDPVASGLVASLARPGGNVTGLTWDVSPAVAGKYLELLRDTKPGLSSVAVVWNRDAGAWVSPYLTVLRNTAMTLGLALHPIEVRRPEDIAPAFGELTRRSVQAVYVMWNQVTFAHRTRVGELARAHRLLTIYDEQQAVAAGGLMSYSPEIADLGRRAANYVDRILKGAKPTDLPVEQPTKFNFVINLRTAKALGLTIPPAVLARADEIIN
jgi:putative ABC transport system substrate-binding protein